MENLRRIEETVGEIERLVGYKIDIEKVKRETAEETFARLERVAEKIKEWKEVS